MDETDPVGGAEIFQVRRRPLQVPMLGSDKSLGYCLEMICADFPAAASMDGGNPEILLQSISRYYKFLPSTQKEAFLSEVHRKAS
jgi:hypothetical protein